MPSPHPGANLPRTGRTSKHHRIRLIFPFNLFPETVLSWLADKSVRLRWVLWTVLVVPFMCSVKGLELLRDVVLH